MSHNHFTLSSRIKLEGFLEFQLKSQDFVTKRHNSYHPVKLYLKTTTNKQEMSYAL